MNLKKTSVILLLLLGVGCATTPPPSPPIVLSPAQEEMRRMMEGTYTGATTCGRKTGIELKMLKFEPWGDSLIVLGSLRMFNIAGGSKDAEFEIGMRGQYVASTGMLLAQAHIEVRNPNCVLTIGERCLVEERGVGVFRPMIERQRAELMRKGAFNLEAVRDASGQGWHGTIRGPGFECPAMALRHGTMVAEPVGTTGVSTEIADSALAEIRNSQVRYGNEGVASIYWLRQAARPDDAIALARLGLALEAGGPGQPPDLPQAVSYFKMAAEMGEARAQDALARHLAEGKVLPKDLAASNHWAAKARATRDAASRICVAPEVVRAFYELIDQENNSAGIRLLGAMVESVTGMSVDQGRYRILATASNAVGLVNQPFKCVTYSKRYDAVVESYIPEFEYAGEDQNGTPLYLDRSGDAAVGNIVAGTMTQLLNEIPMIARFTVTPLEGKRYRITSIQDIRVSAHDFSREVTINTDRPSSPPSKQKKTTTQTPSSDHEMTKAVDKGFRIWSASWITDTYVPDSSVVAKTQCNGNECMAGGSFEFDRGNARTRIPFTAWLRSSANIPPKLVRLCYRDGTSGMADCRKW